MLSNLYWEVVDILRKSYSPLNGHNQLHEKMLRKIILSYLVLLWKIQKKIQYD